MCNQLVVLLSLTDLEAIKDKKEKAKQLECRCVVDTNKSVTTTRQAGVTSFVASCH